MEGFLTFLDFSRLHEYLCATNSSFALHIINTLEWPYLTKSYISKVDKWTHLF